MRRRISYRWLGGMILAAISAGCCALLGDCVSPPDAILAWWPGDGSRNDIVGHHDAGLENGATIDGTGLVGQAFKFDGRFATAYVYPPPDPNPSHLSTTRITVMAWVEFDSLDSFQPSEPGLQYVVFKG